MYLINSKSTPWRVGRENIFKLTVGNESLHEISNDNGVRGWSQ
jgi:hypothetical protein